MSGTITQVKTRLETLLTGLGLTALTGAENAVARTSLPAVAMRARAATREFNGRQDVVTRRYVILLLAAEVQSDQEEDVQDGFELVYPWLETIPSAFKGFPRLERTTGALTPLVMSTGPMEDSGALCLPYKGQIYAGAAFTLPIVTTTR